MWYLTNLHTDKVVFVKDKKTTIGRKGSQIELENDASLSRIHAFLILEGGILKIQDAKSKYGTFLNDKKADSDKLKPEETVKLEDGDSILFGKFNNEWIVHRVEFKTAISMLDQEKREKLTKILGHLEIPIASDFDQSCSHLTMPIHTSVSHKLLQALTMCKPVVTPKFWVAFQEAKEKNQPLPKYLDYLPKLKEETFIDPTTISLAMDENRRKVFNGKTFFFLSSSQMETYEEVIKSGGGKCVSISRAKVTVTQCCAKNAVVIQCKENATQSINDETISKIRAALTKKKRRMVPEMEIGTAVLNASTNLWCNPEQSAVSSLLINQVPSDSQLRVTKSKTIVHESLPVAPPPAKKARQVEVIDLDSDEEVQGNNKENVPETLDTQMNLPETQASAAVDLPETQASDLPETQESFVSAVSHTEVNNNGRSTRSSSGSPQKVVKASLFNSTAKSDSIASGDLFNFTSTSVTTMRKRKNSESVEAPVPSTSSKPAAKKTRVIADEDSEDDLPPPPPKPSRKRPAADAGELFSFNTSFAKRLKPVVASQGMDDSFEGAGRPSRSAGTRAESSRNSPGPSGTLIKPPGSSVSSKNLPGPPKNTPEPSIIPDESDDSCDSGIWLSRAMTSVTINDTTDAKSEHIVKTELIEETVDSEDLKLSRCATLFSVLETSGDVSVTNSSLPSKRKQFVKKRNFKPQSNVVTMKVIRVEDTFGKDDDF